MMSKKKLVKDDAQSALEKVTKRNYLVDVSISLFITFILTYTLYQRIKLNFYSSDDNWFMNIFLTSYFLVAFIPLYRCVNLMALKKTIEVFKKYGVTESLLVHYAELKIKSWWYLLHLSLTMTIFFLIFAIT